ncbi:hypothetical protein [Noviherbaspirillum sp.]|uniref:hypothetical protein n=1 Tax=Noviherbaspirillum sp. TaxID=1926288 RepID=UPI002D33DC00|nr:hypothetical protein [Noviherbaspirillum sp.]HZW19826.1 hypothetical protein [Noviherbaspirillum sp.]
MLAWFLAAALLLPLSQGLSAALPVPAQQEQPAGDEEEDTPRDGMPVTADTERKVRAFLDRFVDPEKTPEEQAELFTERAEYYEHGYVDREDIVRDVQRYVRHWPERRYTVAGIDFMSADPRSDRIFVSYTIDFEVARGEKSVAGKASYGAIIKDIDSEPKVESIKEKVHARSSGSNR